MPQVLDIQNFISQSNNKGNIIDVRTPKEFQQGHIPSAINIPLFTNEERVIVGTIYKQNGKQAAIIKGLEFVGPKMVQIVASAQLLAINNTVYVHCWRGGMRSGSVAWLLELYGLTVCSLAGGYKAFRNFALVSFNMPLSILVLGGKTGSGKTLILQHLQKLNQQVINLEGLANHKGSAFGALGENEQPTQEQFENELALKIASVNPNVPVWLEDESRLIGKKVIPNVLWEKMRATKIFYISLPFDERVNYLVAEYGKFNKEDLKISILKISARLGNEQTKKCLEALQKNDLKTTCELCLKYYDKTYSHGFAKREKLNISELNFEILDVELISNELIKQTYF